jgi:hypothetical protein
MIRNRLFLLWKPCIAIRIHLSLFMYKSRVSIIPLIPSKAMAVLVTSLSSTQVRRMMEETIHEVQQHSVGGAPDVSAASTASDQNQLVLRLRAMEQVRVAHALFGKRNHACWLVVKCHLSPLDRF